MFGDRNTDSDGGEIQVVAEMQLESRWDSMLASDRKTLCEGWNDDTQFMLDAFYRGLDSISTADFPESVVVDFFDNKCV